jgi:hypothetical protein
MPCRCRKRVLPSTWASSSWRPKCTGARPTQTSGSSSSSALPVVAVDAKMDGRSSGRPAPEGGVRAPAPPRELRRDTPLGPRAHNKHQCTTHPRQAPALHPPDTPSTPSPTPEPRATTLRHAAAAATPAAVWPQERQRQQWQRWQLCQWWQQRRWQLAATVGRHPPPHHSRRRRPSTPQSTSR